MNSIELEIKGITREIVELSKDYNLLHENYVKEKDAEMKRSYEERRDAKMTKIKELEEKIKRLKHPTESSFYDVSSFKDNLPKIDFEEVTREAQRVLGCMKQGKRGDALFLIQNSRMMEGELFMPILTDVFKNSTGDFKSYEVDFFKGGGSGFNDFLNQLSRHLGFDESIQISSEVIIETILGSVKIGSVIFLSMHGWNHLDLPCHRSTVEKFIQTFWVPLIARLNDREKYRRVKIIATLVTDKECWPDQDVFDEYTKEDNQFFWLSLPLRNWKEEEVQEWLENYSSMDAQSIKALTRSVLDERLDEDGVRYGIPNVVRQDFQKRLLNSINQ
jgi:hypothetical protein